MGPLLIFRSFRAPSWHSQRCDRHNVACEPLARHLSVSIAQTSAAPELADILWTRFRLLALERRSFAKGSRTRFPGILAIAAFVALATLPIGLAAKSSSAATDAMNFHVPQINQFLRHPFDLFHYPATSATTPGHHATLAYALRLLGYSSVGFETLALRLLNVAVGCVPVWLAWLTCARLSRRPWFALTLVAPFLASNYVVSAATFVTTDNGALAFYALALFLLIHQRASIGPLAISFAGMLAWRQLYLPIGGAIAAALSIDRWDRPLLGQVLRPGRAFTVTVTLAPGLVLFGSWVLAWRGLVPPEFQGLHGLSLKASLPVQALALFGLYSLIYAPALVMTAQRLDARRNWVVAGLALSLALVLWALDGSTFDGTQGRWGSVVWLVARIAPSIGNKSFGVLLLLCVGSYAVTLLVAASTRERTVQPELLAFLAYVAGYSAQPFPWQRYVEPQILLTLAIASSRCHAAPRWTALPALLAAAAMAAACLVRVSGLVLGWL